MPVHEIRHPMIRHKLGIMRRADLSTKSFRELSQEVGALLDVYKRQGHAHHHGRRRQETGGRHLGAVGPVGRLPYPGSSVSMRRGRLDLGLSLIHL